MIQSIILIRIVGAISLSFFGLILFTLINKYFRDKDSGIIISKKGIIDNSSYVGVGLIKWEDIISIEQSMVNSTKFILIKTKNPKKYLNSPNLLKLKLQKANYNVYGTPISISANFVSCDFNQLEKLILNGFEQYKMNS